MPTRLCLFGGARLTAADGSPLQGRSAHRRRLAMLAILGAARGRPVGRERITGLLWPDAEPAHARHSLVESLSVIRRELADDPFVCVGDEVALDPARMPCDVEEFRRAVSAGDADAALELYAGPFLEGFVVKDAPEFERWAEEERTALASALARVLEADAERRELAGDAAGAVRAWRRLAAQERYSTRIALRLARALEAVGDPAAALQQLTVHEALLREELELAASPELAEALEALRNGDPSRPAAPAPPAPAAAAPAPGPAPASELPPASEVLRHHDAPEPPPQHPPFTTVWLAAPAAPDQLRSETPEAAARVQAQLHGLARRAAEHAGGTLEGVVGDAVLARFAAPRAAAAAAVALLRRWEAWCVREGVSVKLVIGMDRGRRETPDERTPDEATRRASVLRSRGEPGSVVTTGAVAREAGTFAGVASAPCGAASLPGADAPEPLVCLTVSPGRPAPGRVGGAARPAAPLAGRRLPGAALRAVAGGLVVAGAAWFFTSRPWDAEPGETGVEERSRIAIMGCDAPAGAEALRETCDGTMDLLAVTLSRVAGIDVVRPLTGAEGRPYWPAGEAMDSVARRVDGLLLLSARVEEEGGRYRQVVFLSDPLAGGVILDADTLETLENGFSLEETLAERTSTLLRRQLGKHWTVRRAGRGTRSAEARRWLVRARQLRYEAMDSLESADELSTALAMRVLADADTLLMRAERADPRWVAPVVERGWIALVQGDASPPEARHAHWRRALRHAERAVARGDDASALELRARARWELTEAAAYADSAERMISRSLSDLQRARELDEERASTLYALSELLYYHGDFTASLYAAEQAYRADPYLEGAMALQERRFRSVLSIGRLDVAGEHCRDGARNYPKAWRFVECELLLAARGAGPADTAAAASLRRRLEATVQPDRADSVGLDYQPIHWQVLHAAVLARAGATERARRELDEARRSTRARLDAAARRGTPSDDDWISFRFDEAQVLQLLGDSTVARRALDDIVARRPHHRGFVRNEAVFRALFASAPRRSLRSTASP